MLRVAQHIGTGPEAGFRLPRLLRPPYGILAASVDRPTLLPVSLGVLRVGVLPLLPLRTRPGVHNFDSF